jgi:predicted secreted hydrolase
MRTGQQKTASKTRHPLGTLLAVLGAVLLWWAPAGSSAQAAVSKDATLLQFTAGDHVLGFGINSLYVASADHMVKVDLVSTRSVAPVVEAGAASAEAGAPGMAPPLGRVTYPQVWDGVTVVYEGMHGGLVKSTYRIEPGTQGLPVDQIRLAYNRPVQLDGKGDLAIRYDTGQMVEQAPVAWQEIGGAKKPVAVSYRLHGAKEVGFKVEAYDPAFPLVIDPALSWNTFLGDIGGEGCFAIAVDAGGNVYVAGYGSATWGTPVRPFTAVWDAFAAKLTSDGTLVWNTFLGGAGTDYGQAIAVDTDGNVYVAGLSTDTWGTPVRAHTLPAPNPDAFAAKLTNNGALTWNTFLGSTTTDWGYALAVDAGGNVYVTGYSDATWGSPVRAYTAPGLDAFAAKLTNNGDLTFNTFLGGAGTEYGQAIAVDAGGNVYVAGLSTATWGAPVRAYTAGIDAFAAKLDSNLVLSWNTFLGGVGTDWGDAIAVDAGGNVTLAGYSDATWGTPVRAYTAGVDTFAARLTSAGALTWNTFLGGAGTDYGYGIAVDASGNVYVAGLSTATWGTPVRAFTASGADAFAAKLASDGALAWSAFLGGAGTDYGQAIAVDANGDVYLAGYSTASWGVPVRPYNAGADGFVAKFPASSVLVFFRATPVVDHMQLAWETSVEPDVVGFYLQRADVPPGSPYARLNAAAIPATGTPATGAAYSYQDFAVTLGDKYNYQLEDIDTTGISSFHPPISAVFGNITLQSPAKKAQWSALDGPAFTWDSVPYNRFRLQFSQTARFSSQILTLRGKTKFTGQGKWITKKSYNPTTAERKRIAGFSGPNGKLFWRVQGTTAAGDSFTTKASRLTVR